MIDRRHLYSYNITIETDSVPMSTVSLQWYSIVTLDYIKDISLVLLILDHILESLAFLSNDHQKTVWVMSNSQNFIYFIISRRQSLYWHCSIIISSSGCNITLWPLWPSEKNLCCIPVIIESWKFNFPQVRIQWNSSLVWNLKSWTERRYTFLMIQHHGYHPQNTS